MVHLSQQQELILLVQREVVKPLDGKVNSYIVRQRRHPWLGMNRKGELRTAEILRVRLLHDGICDTLGLDPEAPASVYDTRMAVGTAASRAPIGVRSCSKVSGQVISLMLGLSRVPSSTDAVICATISSWAKLWW
jgi:hypothetical protein